MERFLRSLGIHFSNNIDIEVTVDPLLDKFEGNGVALYFLLGLDSNNRLHIRSVYHIPDFFLFEYSLRKVSPLGPVLKAAKLFSFILTIIVFGSYCDGNNIRG